MFALFSFNYFSYENKVTQTYFLEFTIYLIFGATNI